MYLTAQDQTVWFVDVKIFSREESQSGASLTQDWFSRLSTFLSIVLRQFVTKLHSLLFPLYFHRLSTRPCPISYSFYTLYKWLHRHWHTPIIKYSDDSAMEDLSNSDSVYFAEAERFSNWCGDNSLDLNVKKTKEMLTDFQKSSNCHSRYLYWWRESWKSDWVQISRNSLRQQAEFNKNTTLFTKDVSQEYFVSKS